MKKHTNEELINIATQLRIDVFNMLIAAGSGHAAGPLSSADIFTFLYFDYLKHDSQNLSWEDRDYFLLSNGHICPIWYSALARSGYFPAEELLSLRKFGSRLQGHPWNIKTPGVFNSSGALGNGGGQAVGVAIGLKMDNKPNHVYCVLSDGEHQEGSTWEAIMSASKFKLDNLTFIVDRNRIQIDAMINDVMPLDSADTEKDEFAEKYKSFMWDVINIDGHDFDELRNAFEAPRKKGVPKAIIANTIAGKGVPEIENNPRFHDWRGDNELAARAIKHLQTKLSQQEL
jgi:transketolase